MNDQRHIQDGGDVPSDPELSRLYRQGAREEPPPHMDAAVLAAARRSAHSGPSPVDKPRGSPRRWYVPLALAAVLVLSVSVAILSPEMDHLPQSDEGAPPAAATYEQRAPQERQAPSQSPPAPPADPAPQSAPSARRSEKAALPERPVSPPAIAQEAPAVQREDRLQRSEDVAPSGARDAEQAATTKREVAPRVLSAPQEQSRAASPSFADSDPPEKWGERIMALRVQGNAREADALLEEFKKRFPDYAIPEAWTR